MKCPDFSYPRMIVDLHLHVYVQYSRSDFICLAPSLVLAKPLPKEDFEKVGRVQDTHLYSHADVCVQYISTRMAVCIVCMYIYIYYMM